MTELVVRLSPEDLQALAVAVADELERRQANTQNGSSRSFPALLSLSEAADELAVRMPDKTAEQWRRWLYDATPRGRVPGARKVAERWWFPADLVDTIGGEP